MTLQSAFYSVSIVQSSLASPAKRSLLRPIRAQVEPSEKSVEIMRKFSEQYARRSGTYFCVDKTVTSVVIKGLADHKDSLGAPLCPCRHYDDKAAEVGQGFWNCPCVPMRERTIIYPKSRQSTHKSHLLLQTQEDDWVINLKNGESWNSYTNRRRGENGC